MLRLPDFFGRKKKRPHYYADAFVKWKPIYFKQPARFDRILSFLRMVVIIIRVLQKIKRFFTIC